MYGVDLVMQEKALDEIICNAGKSYGVDLVMLWTKFFVNIEVCPESMVENSMLFFTTHRRAFFLFIGLWIFLFGL